MAQNEHRRSQPEAIFSGAVTPPPSLRLITCGPTCLTAGRAHREQGAAVSGHVRGPLLAGQHVVEAGGDVGVVVEAEDLGVDVLLAEGGGELGAVALGQAADGGHLHARLGRRDYLVDRLLLGCLDEAARVDEDDVRVLSFVTQRPPARRQASGELLGVHLVARAAESDQADGTGTRHTQSVRDCEVLAVIGRRRAGSTAQPTVTGVLLSGLMLSLTTWTVLICWCLPFTVRVTPGGLPITIETAFFSCQVMVEPASTVPW